MQFTQESKSQLAKLMASENIRVEHRNVSTAMFNLKDRVLTVPVWKDMSGDLYDLLLGHEVGHALETPEQGWHDAVLGSGKFNRSFKHFLNVVEDCRIEKKIKRRFPGLRPSFIKGYSQLMARDFFGIGVRDVNTLPFIDRLNLYTKAGVNTGIKFTAEEQIMVDQVEGCETWDDVVRVTETVYGYSKDEQHQMRQDLDELSSSGSGDGDGEESDEFGDGEQYSDEFGDGDGDGDEFGDEPGDDDTDTDTKQGNKIERFKESQPISGLKDEPVCVTDENFRENESKLVDARSRPYVYVEIPTPIMSEILTPCARVHEQMEQYWFDHMKYSRAEQDRVYSEFKQKNDRYIGLLAKEFEMRKAASKFAKQKISETGDIDVSRIYKYQVDDNIFRKMTSVAKGKSHGLVLMFDRSGSMDRNMAGTIEQFLILALFCRKVNIPFVVYGFGNETEGFKLDNGRYQKPSFTHNVNEINMHEVCLREYLNSRMNTRDFVRCIKNLVCLMNSYRNRNDRKFNRPRSELLSNTPMIEAMVALKPLTEEFRKSNNLDIVNMILLHDGDSDNITSYRDSDGHTKNMGLASCNVIIRDTKSKIEYAVRDLEYDCGLREAVFNWYQKTTGAKIIGFYITSDSVAGIRGSVRLRYYDAQGKNLADTTKDLRGNAKFHAMNDRANDLAKKIKEEKFLESNNPGYKKFFFVPGGDELSSENEGLTVQGPVTTAKLKNAFIKMNVKRQISRVLVNKFIGEIAV